MKKRRLVKGSLFILFVGTVFCSQLIAFSVVNKIGEYEKTVRSIVITSLVLTTFFCTEYLVLRALYYKIRGKGEEKSIGDEIYELFCAGK